MKTAKNMCHCGTSRKMKHSTGLKKGKAANARSKGNRAMLKRENQKYRK